MQNELPSANDLKFKLNPAGKEMVVFLKCTGIATGTYTIRAEIPGKTTQAREGNIEHPERHSYPAGEGIRKISVTVKSVPFFAGDPGGYRVVVEQEGGTRLETPDLPYNYMPEITIESGSA